MALLSAVFAFKVMAGGSPVYLAIVILLLSVTLTTFVFDVTFVSWLSFVVILTFSSGMMTLFMYVSSLAPNEKSFAGKSLFWVAFVVFLFTSNVSLNFSVKKSMQMFSSHLFILFMTSLILLSMVSISYHGHHPNQTLSSSF